MPGQSCASSESLLAMSIGAFVWPFAGMNSAMSC